MSEETEVPAKAPYWTEVPAPTLFQYSNVAGGGSIDPYRVY